MRLPPTIDLREFEKTHLQKWTEEEGVSYEFVQHAYDNPLTSVDPEKNKFWGSFARTAESLGMTLSKEIFPAATDSRYIREIDVPAIGFSPMNHTPILLHDHNEYLNEKTFLDGIDVFERLIPTLAHLD